MDNSKGVAKRFIMLCAPFILYSGAIILLSVFFFNTLIISSPIVRAIMSGNNAESSEGEIDHEMIFVKPEPKKEDDEVYYNEDDFPAIMWGKKWAVMSIEYLGAKDIPVYEGDTDTVLNAGVAHSFFSKFPGQGSNCVLSFHVNRQKQLYYLQDIPLGELIAFDTCYGKYVYRVTSVDVFEATDASLVTRREGEMLTIYTCYPNKGPYRKQRVAITGELVKELSDPTWR